MASQDYKGKRYRNCHSNNVSLENVTVEIQDARSKKYIYSEVSAAEVVAQLAGLEIDSDSCKNMNEYKKRIIFFLIK